MSVSIVLVSMAWDAALDDPDLLSRANTAPQSPVFRWFLATDRGEAVAFVVRDIWPDDQNVILYELYVPPRLWRHGVGSATLVAIEAYVRSLGRTRLELDARPLTEQLAQDWLARWYERRGYVRSNDQSDKFGKEFHQLPRSQFDTI